MRVLAIGDVHGCLTAWDTLLEAVALKQEDLLVTLGDYVDRGPDSRGVLNRLLSLKKTHRLITLAGNHEQMMLEARHDAELRKSWLACGGQVTLDSYASAGRPGTLNDVPEAHWEFLASCPDWLETERWLFVHANMDHRHAPDHQTVAILRWQKFEDPQPHVSGKTLICGHTRQITGIPRNFGHAVCIDTWVYGNGWLSCLEPSTGHVWQANQRGQRRELWLDDHLESPLVQRTG